MYYDNIPSLERWKLKNSKKQRNYYNYSFASVIEEEVNYFQGIMENDKTILLDNFYSDDRSLDQELPEEDDIIAENWKEQEKEAKNFQKKSKKGKLTFLKKSKNKSSIHHHPLQDLSNDQLDKLNENDNNEENLFKKEVKSFATQTVQLDVDDAVYRSISQTNLYLSSTNRFVRFYHLLNKKSLLLLIFVFFTMVLSFMLIAQIAHHYELKDSIIEKNRFDFYYQITRNKLSWLRDMMKRTSTEMKFNYHPCHKDSVKFVCQEQFERNVGRNYHKTQYRSLLDETKKALIFELSKTKFIEDYENYSSILIPQQSYKTCMQSLDETFRTNMKITRKIMKELWKDAKEFHTVTSSKKLRFNDKNMLWYNYVGITIGKLLRNSTSIIFDLSTEKEYDDEQNMIMTFYSSNRFESYLKQLLNVIETKDKMKTRIILKSLSDLFDFILEQISQILPSGQSDLFDKFQSNFIKPKRNRLDSLMKDILDDINISSVDILNRLLAIFNIDTKLLKTFNRQRMENYTFLYDILQYENETTHNGRYVLRPHPLTIETSDQKFYTGFFRGYLSEIFLMDSFLYSEHSYTKDRSAKTQVKVEFLQSKLFENYQFMGKIMEKYNETNLLNFLFNAMFWHSYNLFGLTLLPEIKDPSKIDLDSSIFINKDDKESIEINVNPIINFMDKRFQSIYVSSNYLPNQFGYSKEDRCAELTRRLFPLSTMSLISLTNNYYDGKNNHFQYGVAKTITTVYDDLTIFFFKKIKKSLLKDIVEIKSHSHEMPEYDDSNDSSNSLATFTQTFVASKYLDFELPDSMDHLRNPMEDIMTNRLVSLLQLPHSGRGWLIKMSTNQLFDISQLQILRKLFDDDNKTNDDNDDDDEEDNVWLNYFLHGWRHSHTLYRLPLTAISIYHSLYCSEYGRHPTDLVCQYLNVGSPTVNIKRFSLMMLLVKFMTRFNSESFLTYNYNVLMDSKEILILEDSQFSFDVLNVEYLMKFDEFQNRSIELKRHLGKRINELHPKLVDEIENTGYAMLELIPFVLQAMRYYDVDVNSIKKELDSIYGIKQSKLNLHACKTNKTNIHISNKVFKRMHKDERITVGNQMCQFMIVKEYIIDSFLDSLDKQTNMKNYKIFQDIKNYFQKLLYLTIISLNCEMNIDLTQLLTAHFISQSDDYRTLFGCNSNFDVHFDPSFDSQFCLLCNVSDIFIYSN
ncbi:hypothetical protein SNEBB_002501 [Seison nebaliae]|nr:hypothetical protein SNEBB_002501 [Seison nebaliae]